MNGVNELPPVGCSGRASIEVIRDAALQAEHAVAVLRFEARLHASAAELALESLADVARDAADPPGPGPCPPAPQPDLQPPPRSAEAPRQEPERPAPCEPAPPPPAAAPRRRQ